MQTQKAIHDDDAITLGKRIMEMADRVMVADKFLPGAQAEWGFSADDVQFDVVVSVRRGAT